MSTLRLRSLALSAALGLTIALSATVLPAAAAGLDKPAAETANQADACISGYVWRLASPTDHVCVTPATRTQTATDNGQAAARRDASTANSCAAGFVWREAYVGDVTCVAPATRTQVKYDNNQAPNRVAR